MSAPATRRDAYAAAGVDVDAGERAVELLRARLRGMPAVDLLGGLGAFAAAVALPPEVRQPVVVTATDGVGTKTEIARRLGRLETIGWDLVAMCVDDLVCHGARPWLFLDYLAVGRLDPEAVATIVGGVAAACRACGCSLVGGETAEHPGVMPVDAFDLAGFCVGLAEREKLLDPSRARAGDAIIGLASSGLHANGFSLVRAVLEDQALDLHTPFREVVAAHLGPGSTVGEEESERTLGEVLLTPSRLYAPDLLAAFATTPPLWHGITGLAHITGGGLPGNLPRAVAADLGVEVDPAAWPVPAAIRLISALAGLSDTEMRATFNGGVGMAVVVEHDRAADVSAWAASKGLGGWRIGRVVPAPAAGAGRYREVA